jgi:hypothetical protein
MSSSLVITGEYTEDYDITSVDEKIKAHLTLSEQEKRTRRAHFVDARSRLENKLATKPLTRIAREKIQKRLQLIEVAINDLDTSTPLDRYIKQTRSLVDKYKRMGGYLKVELFGVSGVVQKVNSMQSSSDRQAIVQDYLDIAKQYADIRIVRRIVLTKRLCVVCSGELDDISSNLENKTCPRCFAENVCVVNTKTSKETTKTPSVNDDESMENFLKAWDRYQGVEADKPPDVIHDELDRYFVKRGRPTGAEIRKLPLVNKRRGDTNPRMLWSALQAIGRSDYCANANSIGRDYWGWELDNVEHLKARVVDHYIKTQKVFREIPIECRDRDSSLGTQYRLWRHLQLVGHDCDVRDFKIAENTDSLRTHNRLWKLMCEGAGDPDIYYIK